MGRRHIPRAIAKGPERSRDRDRARWSLASESETGRVLTRAPES